MQTAGKVKVSRIVLFTGPELEKPIQHKRRNLAFGTVFFLYMLKIVSRYFSLQKSIDYSLLITMPRKT